MAVGLDFLSKTKSSGMQDVMSPKSTNGATAGNSSQSSSIFSQNPSSSATKSGGQNMATMNTSDLIKYVYQNNGGDVNIKDQSGTPKKDDGKDDVKLPLTVEYGDQQFSSHGKKMEELAKDISKKTGDSEEKVTSELKRKYSTSTKGAKQAGVSLNMQA